MIRTTTLATALALVAGAAAAYDRTYVQGRVDRDVEEAACHLAWDDIWIAIDTATNDAEVATALAAITPAAAIALNVTYGANVAIEMSAADDRRLRRYIYTVACTFPDEAEARITEDVVRLRGATDFEAELTRLARIAKGRMEGSECIEAWDVVAGAFDMAVEGTEGLTLEMAGVMTTTRAPQAFREAGTYLVREAKLHAMLDELPDDDTKLATQRAYNVF